MASSVSCASRKRPLQSISPAPFARRVHPNVIQLSSFPHPLSTAGSAIGSDAAAAAATAAAAAAAAAWCL